MSSVFMCGCSYGETERTFHFCSKAHQDKWRAPFEARVTELEAEVARLRAHVSRDSCVCVDDWTCPRCAALAAPSSPKPDPWADKPTPDDAAINAAFPTRSGRHDLYAKAMEMVGDRHSKGALVALVNWLLLRTETRTAGWLSPEAVAQVRGVLDRVLHVPTGSEHARLNLLHGGIETAIALLSGVSIDLAIAFLDGVKP